MSLSEVNPLADDPHRTGQRRRAVAADRAPRRPPAAVLLGAPARLPALRDRRGGHAEDPDAPPAGLSDGADRPRPRLGLALPRPDHHLPAARPLPLRRPSDRQAGAAPPPAAAGGGDDPDLPGHRLRHPAAELPEAR